MKLLGLSILWAPSPILNILIGRTVMFLRMPLIYNFMQITPEQKNTYRLKIKKLKSKIE